MPERDLLLAVFEGKLPHGRGNSQHALGHMTPALAPIEKATSNDFRWAAGFYEGEGSCHGAYGTMQVSISQKDVWTMGRMKALFGGSIYTRANGIHIWHISGARARGFIQSIFGLLSPRRQGQVLNAMMDGL